LNGYPFLYGMKKIWLAAILLAVTCFAAIAQDRVTTFGFGYKPIFPSSYFRTGPKDFSDKGINYTIAQQSGFTAGGLIRHGISNRISFESGIMYTKRNYDLSIIDSTFTGRSNFKIIGYEIPVNGLVFIQLGQKLWMNVTMGLSLDIFPSDIYTDDNYYRHYSARNKTVNSGLNAMTGLEYRTKKGGYIYLGAAYHRTFSHIYESLVEYYPDRTLAKPPTSIGRTRFQGDYFTFDVRYYFHEAPKKKK